MRHPLLSRFEDDVAAQIEAAAAPRGERSVAVFDFDNTCIFGDIGELFGHYLIEKVGYRYDLDEFWDLIDPEDGRDEIRRLVGELERLGEDDPGYTDVYDRYVSEMAAIYPRKLAREGKRSTYEWAVKLHVGLTEDEVLSMSADCCAEEWRRPLEPQLIHTDRGEEILIRRGLRRHGAIGDVMRWLTEQGHEVWVVSATNEWTVRQAAKAVFGIDAARVRGNRVTVRDGTLTATTEPPVLYREGKVALIEREIGVRPILVFGDSDTDLDMMKWAESAVLIDHGNAEALALAHERDWAIQPQDALELEDAP